MESKLEGTVNYLQFIDSTLDAAKQTEEPQDRPPKQQEEAYLGLPINLTLKTNLQRWQIALALMSPLEVHGVREW